MARKRLHKLESALRARGLQVSEITGLITRPSGDGEPASTEPPTRPDTKPGSETAAVEQRQIDVAHGVQQSFGFDVTHGFLGEEFLLWLWFQSEVHGGEFVCCDHGLVGIAFDDLLVFARNHDDETQQTMRRGAPTVVAESRSALRTGHRLAKARLLVAVGARQWSLVLDGTHMTFSGVRLEADPDECETHHDRNTARAASWLDLLDMIELLFEQFLQLRLAADWMTTEARAMATWMAR